MFKEIHDPQMNAGENNAKEVEKVSKHLADGILSCVNAMVSQMVRYAREN